MRPELKVIERDKNGFATDECLEQMQQALPIAIVSDTIFLDIVVFDTWEDWQGEIERLPKYTHYFKCPQL